MTATPAYCHRCGQVTETVFLVLTGDLIGNCCATCRACRKGRPYITRAEYRQYLDAHPGRRDHNANQTDPV